MTNTMPAPHTPALTEPVQWLEELPSARAPGEPAPVPWCVLIVDDDSQVHDVTRLALKGFEFEQRPLEFLSAYSAAEGRLIFQSHPRIALAIVDVIMETENAGLDLVRFVRQTLDNRLTRLVLRTGQSGHAPQDSAIRDYDIDDYKEKTELTARKLHTLLYSMLRSYRDLCLIETQRSSLEDTVAQRTAELRQVNQVLQEDVQRREKVERVLTERNGELLALNSKLRSAHDQLIQSERLASIGQLAAGVAHEINNPIGYIFSNFSTLEKYLDSLFTLLAAYESREAPVGGSQTAAELQCLKDGMELEFLKEDVPNLMKESREGILRVRKIVKDLKDFSHVDATQDWQLFNLNQGIESTLNVVNHEIKYKADVVKEFGDLPEVPCMPSQINQVVMNLVLNAAQAMGPERGTITVRTGQDERAVWFEVVDTGTGIPADVLPRIFDPFFTTKSIGQGTGLGLSLSYGIVQKHNGRIDVRSGVGVGTTMRVTLPSVQDVPVHGAERTLR